MRALCYLRATDAYVQTTDKPHGGKIRGFIADFGSTPPQSRRASNYLTSNTGTLTACNTLVATEPKTILAIALMPRVPMIT